MMLKTCPECRVQNDTVKVKKTDFGWECPKCRAKIKAEPEMGTSRYSVKVNGRNFGVQYYG